MSEEPELFDYWAILELFGHTRIAGRVTEAAIGGGHLLRLDVPSVHGRPGFTRFYGANAIYSMTIVEKDVALSALARLAPEPVDIYLMPSAVQQLALLPEAEEEETEDLRDFPPVVRRAKNN